MAIREMNKVRKIHQDAVSILRERKGGLELGTAVAEGVRVGQYFVDCAVGARRSLESQSRTGRVTRNLRRWRLWWS